MEGPDLHRTAALAAATSASTASAARASRTNANAARGARAKANAIRSGRRRPARIDRVFDRRQIAARVVAHHSCHRERNAARGQQRREPGSFHVDHVRLVAATQRGALAATRDDAIGRAGVHQARAGQGTRQRDRSRAVELERAAGVDDAPIDDDGAGAQIAQRAA